MKYNLFINRLLHRRFCPDSLKVKVHPYTCLKLLWGQEELIGQYHHVNKLQLLNNLNLIENSDAYQENLNLIQFPAQRKKWRMINNNTIE